MYLYENWRTRRQITNIEKFVTTFAASFLLLPFYNTYFTVYSYKTDKRNKGVRENRRDSQISIAHFAIANWIKEIALQNNTSSIKFFTNYLLEAIYKRQARLSLTVLIFFEFPENDSDDDIKNGESRWRWWWWESRQCKGMRWSDRKFTLSLHFSMTSELLLVLNK